MWVRIRFRRRLERDLAAVTRSHLRNGEADVTLGIWRVNRWQGVASNRRPDGHDLLGWFTAGDLAGLALAHADYQPLLQKLLTER